MECAPDYWILVLVRTFILVAVFALVNAAGLLGCQNPRPGGRAVESVPTLSAEAAGAAGFTAQDITVATALYVNKCAKCHHFYHPAQYPQQEWDTWMQKMSRKSKLKPAQEEMLTRFMNEIRRQSPPTGAN